MALTVGRKVGSYEILGKLGEGGMGEVYRARDSKLGREVALKILPAAFTTDVERLARFRAEAQTLATLNHPNIAAIYGFEESASTQDGQATPHALVMELVDGDDLSTRIAHSPMPWAEALPIARQIVDALEAAHDAGIVHRDLKPANIKIRHDGTVKVLDFGLAKAGVGVSSSSNPSAANSPTFTAAFGGQAGHATEMGTVLGTAAYMSPEQARGRPVDRRADIWAFGAVLYEMLTGRRAFDGDDASSTIASVLKDDIRWNALPPDVPTSVVRLLRRCLEKDPKGRLRAIGDARFEFEGEPAAVVPIAASGPSSRAALGLSVVGGVILAGIAAAATWYVKPAAVIPVRRLELPAAIASANEAVISPDGTRVAYVLDNHLDVRALDELDAHDLGVMPDGLAGLVWSPDGASLAFFAEGEVRTIPAAGGPVFVVCKIPATGQVIASEWPKGGRILFAVWRESLYSVPAGGGTPVVAVPLDTATEIDFHSVSSLPDGRLIVLSHQRKLDIALTQLVDRPVAGAVPRRTTLCADESAGPFVYVAPDLLVFVRETTNAGLWAMPFREGPLDLATATRLQGAASNFSVSAEGTVIMSLPAVEKAALVWVDRGGATTALPGAPLISTRSRFGISLSVALSPDGRRAAFFSGLGPDANLFARDLGSGTDAQLTLNKLGAPGAPPAYGGLSDPTWFPAGDRILFTSGFAENTDLMVQRSDAAGDTRTLAKGLLAGRVSADGRTMVALVDQRGRSHLRLVSLASNGSSADPRPLFTADQDPDVDKFDLSPDARFVAYVASHTNDRLDLYLAALPPASGRWLVAENAMAPRFSRDGRELFFAKDSGTGQGPHEIKMMSLRIASGAAASPGVATALFDGSGLEAVADRAWDVAPDGRHFLMFKAVPTAPSDRQREVVLQGWPALVKK